MARSINLQLSDRLESLLKAQAKSRGFSNLDECIVAVLTEALQGLPQIPPTPEQLVLELRRGLDGNGHTPTRQEWDLKKSNLADQHRRSKAG